MREQLRSFALRLRKPSTIISLASQAVGVMTLFGVHFDQGLVMTVVTAGCSILVTLGILSNPDTKSNGYGDDINLCSKEGCLEKHIVVNGKLVCQKCGAVYRKPPESTE